MERSKTYVVYPIGVVLRSRIHGGLITVLGHKMPWTGYLQCRSHDNGLTSDYTTEQLDEEFEFYGWNKAMVMLHGK